MGPATLISQLWQHRCAVVHRRVAFLEWTAGRAKYHLPHPLTGLLHACEYPAVSLDVGGLATVDGRNVIRTAIM